LLREHGIDIARVELVGKSHAPADHLAHYHRIDIAVDTFPYNGTTTTCDALWMGVPVVALAGNRHVARVGASLLHNVGLPELVASSIDDYVFIAAALAKDVERLRTTHQNLREQMRRSPLVDAKAFVRDLEDAYRQMWRAWTR
jgi:predicted O-linked N-acetylglucosamine transferase (SPINDLY family)